MYANATYGLEILVKDPDSFSPALMRDHLTQAGDLLINKLSMVG